MMRPRRPQPVTVAAILLVLLSLFDIPVGAIPMNSPRRAAGGPRGPKPSLLSGWPTAGSGRSPAIPSHRRAAPSLVTKLISFG